MNFNPRTMKTKILILAIITLMGVHLYAADTFVEAVQFASMHKAKKLQKQEDTFTGQWSTFDIEARMQQQNSTKQALMQYKLGETRKWTKADKARIAQVLESIDKEIADKGYHLDLPEQIYFIKSTCAEEGGAEGYTRENYVVLKNSLLENDDAQLKHIVIHELFHVLSRHNPEFKKQLYAIIGFRLIAPLAYPDSLQALRITNPDCPLIDSYITLHEGEKPVKAVMLMYAKGRYTGGNLFSYMNLEFFALNAEATAIENKVDREKVDGFFEQVGKNTHYLISPEEIMAENFTYALLGKTDMPDQHIITSIQQALQKGEYVLK